MKSILFLVFLTLISLNIFGINGLFLKHLCFFKLQAFLIYKRQISLFQILVMFISEIISLILRSQLGNEVYMEMNVLAGGALLFKICHFFLITLLLAVLLTYHQLLASTIPNFTLWRRSLFILLVTRNTEYHMWNVQLPVCCQICAEKF